MSIGEAAQEELNRDGKPVVITADTDGNVFAVIGTVARALKNHDCAAAARDFKNRALHASDYDHVLRISMEYVEFE